MNPFAMIAAGALVLIALFARRTPQKTAWSGQGLPTPVATLAELYALARNLVGTMRGTGRPPEQGSIIEFQRRAGFGSITRPMTPAEIRDTEEIEQRLSRQATREVISPMLAISSRVQVELDRGPIQAGVNGLYDALTRQAVGYYGHFWQEETP